MSAFKIMAGGLLGLAAAAMLLVVGCGVLAVGSCAFVGDSIQHTQEMSNEAEKAAQSDAEVVESD